MSEPTQPPGLPLVGLQTTIRETMSVIDRFAKSIAIVVDKEERLLSTITDGDIRRAILAGVDLDGPVSCLNQTKLLNPKPSPVVARAGASEAELLALMDTCSVRQIPLLDADGRVCELAVLDDFLKQTELTVTGVIMAGGYGKRLLPLTEQIPKPMLPVNGRPLLEHTLDKLRHAGIRTVNLATHHLGDSIMQYFKDGSEFGLQLQYFHETEPLGTAGGLAMMGTGTDTLLVINGDILTGVDIRAMLDFHREHKACLTVGVRQYDIEVPFGVIETEGVKVTGITEKPVLRHFINAGIYMVDRAVCRLVPTDRRFDMTDLIAAVIKSGGHVIGFLVREYWIDIGRIEQYQRAEADVAAGIV